MPARVSGSVKTILIASVLFASLASGFSQTQEAKLIDRVMKPNITLGNPLQKKTYYGAGSVPIKNSASANQGFFGVKDANVKEFTTTHSFLGLKNPWFGGKVFATKADGAVSKYDVKNAGLNKTTDATAYYAATKNAAFGSPVVPVSTYVPAPAANGAVSQISDKVTKKMTIDDVRELLNKPR